MRAGCVRRSLTQPHSKFSPSAAPSTAAWQHGRTADYTVQHSFDLQWQRTKRQVRMRRLWWWSQGIIGFVRLRSKGQ